jgi:predicted O-methyltransferase YrrM
MIAPISPFTGVPGWESKAEQECLIQLARKIPPSRSDESTRIVEIGSEFGMSASLFCLAADPFVFIHCIDLFPGDMQAIHQANLARMGMSERVIYHKGNSQTDFAAWGMGANPGIDLLFVDGDHSYAGVKRDIAAWVRYVKPGGAVAFHDCACMTNANPHPLHFEVTRAVSEWYVNESPSGWIQETMVDSLMVFRRAK